MEWNTELEATCSALGTYDGTKYYKDNDCLECIKDLIRYLRRDDDNHTLRRSLGQIGVVKTDLIPILREYASDTELFDMCLRLMVNLTSPEILLFREEMPEDKTMRNYYLQLQTHRMMYKQAFIDEKLWAVLTENLGNLLRKEFDERSEDDRMVIERMLILVRNILQVPRDAASEKRTEGDVSVHDQVLWVLHKSGMEDLLLFIASSDEETQYCLHVLEIISLMFREQDPKHLATANFQRSKEEKIEDELALLKLRNQEQEKKKQRFHQFATSRHSRFGGTFTVQNIKSISDRDLIYHKPLSAVNQIDFNKQKRPMKVAKNRLTPGDCDVKRRSTLSIRLFLKEFCVEFLHGAYNKLMYVVRDYLNRKKAQQNDETYHLWAMKFFMEFNRIHKFRVDLVTETLSKGTFHYVHQQIEAYKDNYEHEKKNRPMCLMWARRMHLAIRAYQELLLNLVAMGKSDDAKVRESAVILRADVFYEPEYRELCTQQLSLYQPEKMSIGYLRDLVETTHVFLKIMENMSKSKHIMVSKKTKRKKKVGEKSKKGSGVQAGTIFMNGSREANEAKWDEISSDLSRILQGQADNVPDGVTPFDAASEVPIDEQLSAAMYRIREALNKARPGEAIALLRASREVWPENDAFGASDADAEDEFMALREILFADIPKPAHLRELDQDVVEEPELAADLMNEEEDEANEFEDEEEQFVTYSVEQEFDFRQFVMKFASKSVCAAFGILFANYERNTEYTNLCIIKMFHRIAFDCSLPALLFHFSIFRTFQRIYKDYCITPTNPSLRELCKFAKFLLRKFFEICPKNSHIFMELCFWKTSREATEIIEGYGTIAVTSKQKASFWCEEDEEKLARVFRQLKEMEHEKGPSEEGGADLLDNITDFFIETGKSRRQVAKKLKDMALIADIKEVTKKPLKMKASRDWSSEEIGQLKELYQEFKDAVDPVKRIMERLPVQRQKKRVVDKIMELGLCDDRKRLMKKKTRRGLKEGDAGYLDKASGTDSAMEDSSEGSQSSSSDQGESDSASEAEGGDSQLELAKALKDLMANEEFKAPLDWLKCSLSEEADDRETEELDGDEGVPILPLTEECIMAMEKEQFLHVMRLLDISPPGNEQEQYWRIPARLSSQSLKTKSSFLGKALQGDYEVGDLDVSHLGGRPKSASKKEKKKKKKEKRGPNKWMPMKRQVDEEALARIEAMFPARQPPPDAKPKKSGKKSESKKSESANSEKKGKKTRRKMKAMEDDLSDGEDKENRDSDVDHSDIDSSDNESDKSEKSESTTETKSKLKKKRATTAGAAKKKMSKSNFLDSSGDESGKLDSDNDESDKNDSEKSKTKSANKKNLKKSFLQSSGDESDKQELESERSDKVVSGSEKSKEKVSPGRKKNAKKSFLESSGDESEKLGSDHSKNIGAKKLKKMKKQLKTTSLQSSGDELDNDESDKVNEDSNKTKRKESPAKKKNLKKNVLPSSGDESDKIDSESGKDSDATIKNSSEKVKRNRSQIVDTSDEEIEPKNNDSILDSVKKARKDRLVLSSDSEPEPEKSKESEKVESSEVKARSRSNSSSSSLCSRSTSRVSRPSSRVSRSSVISRSSSRISSRSSSLASSRSTSRSSSNSSSRASSPRSVLATPSSRAGSQLLASSSHNTPASKIDGDASSVKNTPKRLRHSSGEDSDDINKPKKKSSKKLKLDSTTLDTPKSLAKKSARSNKKQELDSSKLDPDATPKASAKKSRKSNQKQELDSAVDQNTPLKGPAKKLTKQQKEQLESSNLDAGKTPKASAKNSAKSNKKQDLNTVNQDTPLKGPAKRLTKKQKEELESSNQDPEKTPKASAKNTTKLGKETELDSAVDKDATPLKGPVKRLTKKQKAESESNKLDPEKASKTSTAKKGRAPKRQKSVSDEEKEETADEDTPVKTVAKTKEQTKKKQKVDASDDENNAETETISKKKGRGAKKQTDKESQVKSASKTNKKQLIDSEEETPVKNRKTKVAKKQKVESENENEDSPIKNKKPKAKRSLLSDSE